MKESKIKGPTPKTAPQSYYYTRDHLGSIREVVASNGLNVEARYDYSPYGIRTTLIENISSDLGYTGHFSQDVAGEELVLAKYRAYDPTMGRWLSADPIAEQGGLNLYAYVLGNPINATDPDGLREYQTTGIGAAHAAGVSALHKSNKAVRDSVNRGERDGGRALERGGRICKKTCDGKTSYYTTETLGSQGGVAVWSAPKCDSGDEQVGWWHIHGGLYNKSSDSFGNESGFSDADKNFADGVTKNGKNYPHLMNPNRLPLSLTSQTSSGIKTIVRKGGKTIK